MGVGFQDFQVLDYSREYQTNMGRPVEIGIWFPIDSAGNSADHLTFADYVCIDATESENLVCEEWVNLWQEIISGFEGDQPSFNIQGHIMKGIKVNPPKNLQIPVFFYAVGKDGTLFENVTLFETLAENGIAVVAIDSVGTFTDIMAMRPDALETQARDIEVAIGFVLGELHWEPKKIILGGWSWGGLAALLVTSRNRNIDGFISLDGSMALHGSKVSENSTYDPNHLRVPQIYFSSDRTKDFLERFLETIKFGDTLMITSPRWRHIDFSSYPALGGPENANGTIRAEDVYTKAVLDLFASPEANLTRISQNLDNGNDLQIMFREGVNPPPYAHEFLEIVATSGAGEATRIFKEVHQSNPDYVLFYEDDATELAYILMDDESRPEDSIILIGLVAELYPNSFKATFHNGRLREKAGNLETALPYFELALEKALANQSDPERKRAIAYYERKIKSTREKLGLLVE